MTKLSNKINFGDVAVVSGERVISTPMIKFKGAYYMRLEAFSVRNGRIKYEGSKIEGTNTYTQNIVIDSGTPLTMLPPHFYSTLETTVAKLVKLHRI